MAEHVIQRSTSQSSIPVVTPRLSRSSISSTFPLSQTSLVSQLRRTSESTAQPNPVSTVALPQTPVSSIPSFRSIRNLLPFAPVKTSNPPPSPLPTPKSSFVNFGSLRRITHDRKNSVTHSHPQEAEQAPVISIARPSQSFEEEMIARKQSRDINRSTSDLSPSSRTSDECYVLPLPSPGPPLGADLSTIIEAENSGISKHIPHLGDTTHADGDDDTPTSPFNLEQINKSRLPSPDSRAASVFDLSTSRLDAEVMHALKVEGATTGNEWLRGVNSIVVEGANDPGPLPTAAENASCTDKDLDTALDFGALDPDLAELLSPNKINGKSKSLNPVTSRLPSRAHSRSPSYPASTSSLCPPNGGDSPRTSPCLGTVAPPLTSRALVQSSPTRRSASLSHTNPARGPPSSLPRLMRSVTAAPPSTSDSSDGPSVPSALRGPSIKRHQPPSPLSSHTHSNSQIPSPASSRGSTDVPPRRPPGSRFATPHRHVSSYTPGNSRLPDPSTALLPSAMQNEKVSTSKFSPRSASDPARQPISRPSLEINDALEVNKRRRPHLFYSRRRSMSVEEAPLSPTSGSTSSIRPSSSLSNRPPVEWLGPRTVKAFAAAGLLDGDKDGSNAHALGHSKYGSLRTHIEREDRFVPSRMAFSEAASTSSWGRSGSVSRGVTPSEGGLTWGSPTFSAPRTTFSGSTAPTSISATSSSQQAAIQVMKEKHDLETEALLSALSDSQRMTKTLREENIQLRDRIRELEDELDEMRAQIHRFASGVLPPRAPPAVGFAKSPHDRPVLLPSPLAAPRRPAIHRSLSHVHTNGLSATTVGLSPRSSRAASPARGDSPVPVPVAAAAPRPRRRRASTSSSVFPNLPQNMSLLMHEDTMHDRPGLSSTPPSPARGVSQRSSLCNGSCNSGDSGEEFTVHNLAHVHHSSSFSPGPENISPTIASFSMTEIPGSPSSLQLRPEHEMHLGDMASLSLYAMSDEEL